MDRPDTIIELHRERIQALAAGVYAGDTYVQPYEGSYLEKGAATLTLALDRVWFLYDAHGRLWQEETPGQAAHDPRRHLAIDLTLVDSRIVIQSIAGVPLVPLPPQTVTIPNGPRAGEQRQIAYNEIPLFGRLTLHEQLEVRDTAPGMQTVSLNFTAQGAPVLVALPPPDQFVAHLFGPDVERRSDGRTAFAGMDPRVTWTLDYAEAYWITHSLLGTALTAKEKLLHPTATDEACRIAVLDSIAGEIAAAVRVVVAGLGTAGVVDLLPNPIAVDPSSAEGNRALDAVVQQYDVGGATHESMVIQLQTMDPLPIGEDLPPSVLALEPTEQTALATSGFGILRGVRSTVMRSFCLSETDFDPDAACLLDGVQSVDIGGENRTLGRFEATIQGGSSTQPGKLIVEGNVRDDNTWYTFDADFTITYEMTLDDIPREAAPSEQGTSTGETKAQLDAGLREAAAAKCRGDISARDYETEAKRVSDLMMELPRTVGVRPTLSPPEPQVDSSFDLTTAGEAVVLVGLAAFVAALVAPAAFAAGATAIAAAASWEGALLALMALLAAYVALLVDIDWYGTGMVRGKIEDALGDRPGGTLLPTLGVPIDVQLHQHHLAVYFRALPPRLDVGCVKHDTGEDVDQVIQLVGGVWPGDGRPWKISDNDGVLMIDAGALELFITPSGQPIHVSTSATGRRYLRSNPDNVNPDNLAQLPECPPSP